MPLAARPALAPRLRLRNVIPTPHQQQQHRQHRLNPSFSFNFSFSSGSGSFARPRTPAQTNPPPRRPFTSGATRLTGRGPERERLRLAEAAGSARRPNDEMADRIHRVTMFKIADEGQRKRLIEQYKTLGSTQKKDGKPYILSMVVGPAGDDPRAQGFTVVAKTEFASLADMKYYDDECAAHAALKALVKGELDVGGVMSVYFKPEAITSL